MKQAKPLGFRATIVACCRYRKLHNPDLISLFQYSNLIPFLDKFLNITTISLCSTITYTYIASEIGSEPDADVTCVKNLKHYAILFDHELWFFFLSNNNHI